MPEIPSIFNRFDFLGVILPGYVAVILSIVLFRPDLLSIVNKESTFDLFSAVVFLVAGPTVGAVLQIFHRSLYSIRYLIRKGRHSELDTVISNFKGNPSKENAVKFLTTIYKDRSFFLRLYYVIRIHSSAEQKSELEKAESIYDFCISTAIALLLIALSYLIYKFSFDILTIPILVLSAILFLGGYFQREEVHGPLLIQLLKKLLSEKPEVVNDELDNYLKKAP
jgi:hypothetical protein